jgi:hypothetical protein
MKLYRFANHKSGFIITLTVRKINQKQNFTRGNYDFV